MLVVETIARIRRDHLVKGVPIKKIARDLRVSKNTVRKVVRGDETSFSYARKIQPMPKLGPWVPSDLGRALRYLDDAQLDRLLERPPQRRAGVAGRMERRSEGELAESPLR